MSQSRSQLPQLGLAVALLAAAGLFLFRWMNAGSGVSEKAFFYDLSERRLYVADRGLIPPIAGVNDPAQDGVRAVVVSTNGQPEQESTWVIAYLETCAPELKEKLEAAKVSQSAPEISRTTAQGLRLVKRPNDTAWVSLATAEGEQIVSEWLQWGTDKNPPVICTP